MTDKTAMRSRSVLKIFLFLTFASVLCVTVLTTLGDRYFVVEMIEIRGNEKISDREIIKRSGIRAGYTSMFFMENSAEQYIYENPWVKDVSITKEFPGKVIIDIAESEAFCITVDESDTPYYLSPEGKKIGKAKSVHGMDFPVIRTEGKVEQNTLEEAIRLLKLSRTSDILKWSEISEVKLNPDFGIRIFTTDKRTIDFGRGNILGKWYKVEKIISHSREINLQEQYINVSSKNLGVINFNI